MEDKITDLEICAKIAKIQGAVEIFVMNSDQHLTAVFKNRTAFDYNPLTDDALNHQLMAKFKITIEFTRYYEHLKSETIKAYYSNSDNNGYGAFVRDTNLNKAICLAIISKFDNEPK